MEKYYDSDAILNNESYSAEERLEMAKLMLAMKNKQIHRLISQLKKEKFEQEWTRDQSSEHRMGL